MDIQLKPNIEPQKVIVSSAVLPSSDAAKNTTSGTVVANNQTVTTERTAKRAEIEDVISSVNSLVQSQQRTIRFSIDDQSGRDIVTVVDQLTDEVIRQMPAEEMLVIARKLSEQAGDEALNLFSSYV